MITPEEVKEEQKIICQMCDKALEECPEYDECLKATEKWIEIRRAYEQRK